MKNVLFLVVSLLTISVYACMSFDLEDWEARQAPPTEMVDEKFAIVWNPETKREDHIRELSFNTNGGKFAFFVPLPIVPEIYETELIFWNVTNIKNETFTRISPKPTLGWLLNEIEIDKVFNKTRGFAEGLGAPPGSGAGDNANIVLKKTEVAGFEVNVLDMQVEDALSSWLTERNFKLKPAQSDWIKNYREKKWVLTAFEFKGSERGVLT